MHDFWYVYFYNKFFDMGHWEYKLTFALNFKYVLDWDTILLS